LKFERPCIAVEKALNDSQNASRCMIKNGDKKKKKITTIAISLVLLTLEIEVSAKIFLPST